MALLYYNMTCKITVGNLQVDTVNSVTIKQSIKVLSDTAKITLPREFREVRAEGRIQSLEQKNILDFIKVGDAVSISLGYDEDVAEEFTGYVTKVSADIPLLIDCEDEMWKLKQTTFNESFENITLSELLKVIAPDYTHEITGEVNLGKFIIQNTSAYHTLKALRKDYLLHSYFRGKTLVVGFPSSMTHINEHTYHMNRNVRDAGSLKFLRKEDVKLQIKAISNNPDGTKEVVRVGESGGATRTLNFSSKTRDELRQLAEENLNSLHFDGYSGTLSAFGLPRIKAGDAANIIDPGYPDSERDGRFLIEQVRKTFSNNGFKNEVGLSLKL